MLHATLLRPRKVYLDCKTGRISIMHVASKREFVEVRSGRNV